MPALAPQVFSTPYEPPQMYAYGDWQPGGLLPGSASTSFIPKPTQPLASETAEKKPDEKDPLDPRAQEEQEWQQLKEILRRRKVGGPQAPTGPQGFGGPPAPGVTVGQGGATAPPGFMGWQGARSKEVRGMGAMAVLALGIWLILFAIITAIPGAAPIQSVGALVLAVVALVAGILTLTGR